MDRTKSLAYVKQLGLGQPSPSLPLLDNMHIRRSQHECVHRLLAMFVCAATVNGFPISRADRWLKTQGLWEFLTIKEQKHFESGVLPMQYDMFVDSCWSLSWAMSYVEFLKPMQDLPQAFVKLFPDVKIDESIGGFVSRALLRNNEEILQALDTVFCVHNACQDLVLNGDNSKKMQDNLRIIRAQRHSLEWIFTTEDWDEITLDT
jgi:hypothetical protein